MFSSNDSLTRDDALMVLNDHCGQEVEVTVQVDRGDMSLSVASALGVLRHWRQDSGQQYWDAFAREDIIGLYGAGDMTVDITDLDAAGLLKDGENAYGLSFDLDFGVMTIIWGLPESV